MNIALIGYGKMGKAIEAIAMERGHRIVLKIDENNKADFNQANIAKADVAIEFTGPHSAFENVKKLINFCIPTVSGSTGWLEKFEEITQLNNEKSGSFLYASNFSVGVNLFFELNKKLANLMHLHQAYQVSLEEIHHTQKLDAPSGTAITLAEQVMASYPQFDKWVCDTTPQQNELLITSKRIDPAPGTHSITYSSDIDDISITHTAHNRKGFATGAVLAAEYIHNKKGFFTMKEVLGL